MGRIGVRRAALVAALVGTVQVTAGVAASPGAAAGDCPVPRAVFAVNGSTGHLVELASCPDTLTEVGEVDDGDWRTASRIFATGDDTVTVVYRITADGRLEAMRQTAPGAPLEAPVDVGAGIDWSRFRTVIVPRQGYLWADDGDVRAFRHEGWATGGTTLVEGPHVFESRDGMPALGELVLTGLSPAGHAEATFRGRHWLVWRNGPALASGLLPFRATGTESGMYVSDGDEVSRLVQPLDKRPDNVRCPANGMPWRVRTTLSGDWWSGGLAVPQRTVPDGEWPGIVTFPTWDFRCPPGTDPYQWQ
jgi:hypothetical protein